MNKDINLIWEAYKKSTSKPLNEWSGEWARKYLEAKKEELENYKDYILSYDEAEGDLKIHHGFDEPISVAPEQLDFDRSARSYDQDAFHRFVDELEEGGSEFYSDEEYQEDDEYYQEDGEYYSAPTTQPTTKPATRPSKPTSPLTPGRRPTPDRKPRPKAYQSEDENIDVRKFFQRRRGR